MVREHKSGSRPVECEKAEDGEGGGEADKGTCPKGIEEEEEEGGKEDVEEDEPELRRGDRFVKFGGLSFIISNPSARFFCFFFFYYSQMQWEFLVTFCVIVELFT